MFSVSFQIPSRRERIAASQFDLPKAKRQKGAEVYAKA